ncbi:MAG: NAD(P)H-binding protein [Polyangiaceae bacterium]
MKASTGTATLVTGATGFIGRSLVEALVARGERVVALSRRATDSAHQDRGVEWRTCDLLNPEQLPRALAGVRVAYYLVHSMGSGQAGYRALESRAAQAFVAAAGAAGIERIVYLGGPAPPGPPSEHLRSRLEVGEILRGGAVTAVELRAAMVIGNGSASWRIVRDLATRLPVMVLPRWLSSRTRPVALSDVISALMAAATLPLLQSEWFDLPGPDTLSGQQILERIAALRGRRFFALKVPFLTPQLSALWLRLVTRTDFALARELVLGLKDDLLPKDDRIWGLIGHTQLLSFDEAARRALASE